MIKKILIVNNMPTSKGQVFGFFFPAFVATKYCDT